MVNVVPEEKYSGEDWIRLLRKMKGRINKSIKIYDDAV